MKKIKNACAVFFLLVTLFFQSAHAIIDRCHEIDRDYDHDFLANYLNMKRMETWRDKIKDFEIDGDVRAEAVSRRESHDGHQLRGRRINGVLRFPRNTYDVQFNLKFHYKTERSWAHVHLQLEEALGAVDDDFYDNLNNGLIDGEVIGLSIGSGFCDDLCLKRCYWGYMVYEGCNYQFDIEVGRRPLYTIFDSDIQFHARFDGVLFKHSYDYNEDRSNIYVNFGPFVVDNRVNHYAFVGEIGFLNVMDKKIDIRYSYIDWVKRGTTASGVRRPLGTEFRNSQIGAYYNFNKALFQRKAQLYAAWLYNHAAKPRKITHNSKAGQAWYAGFVIGEAKKEGDWALDVFYQWVQAQAIPDFDVHGIGRGNVLKQTFFNDQNGKTNYKGFGIELLYAITDHLSYDLLYEFSNALDPSIGGRHKYSKLEFDLIYAF